MDARNEIPAGGDMDTFAIFKPGTMEPLVTVNWKTGTVEYGADYSPDTAAKIFWNAFKHHMPQNLQLPGAKSLLLEVAADVRTMTNGLDAEHAETRMAVEMIARMIELKAQAAAR